MNSRIFFAICAFGMLPFLGCGTGSTEFSQNKLAVRVGEIQGGFEDEPMRREIYQQIADIMAAVFGTPDQPEMVAGGAEVGFVNSSNLLRAAGPVSNSRLSGDIDDAIPHLDKGQGLYRQHCVHCHGINGDGKGPTASFLNPYPRDFTLGKFKFNSTRIGVPSTHEDLHTILINGINGTAMPSFALLDSGEIEALVDYVKYLSVRGQSERFLIGMATELDEEENIDVSPETIIGTPDDEGISAIIETWKTAEPAVNPEDPNVPIVTENPSNWDDEKKEAAFASVERGRDLYYTAKANCFSCHGNTQLGDGNLGLYDDWAKELYNWQSETDEDGSKKAEYVKLSNGLKPRIIRPRNLRLGQYRGGRRPLDIYWRMYNGIDGAGMPAANGLTNDEIWDLVNYVLYLPYEKISTPSIDLPTLDRARD